jgi:HAD superfamily hydrolase (TIGR01509 family)
VSPGPVTALNAVLFDMDGTLVDSEKLWTIALEQVAAGLGGTLSAGARAAMVGQDLDASVRTLKDDLGTDAPHAEVAAALMTATEQMFRRGLPWLPGAERLIDEVRAAGIATALVTATHRNLVEIALETLGRHRFDVEVCGDEVLRPKPDPQPYLRALELLGVGTDRAVAIEDSPTGSRSAAAAGLPVLVVPSEVPVPAAPGLVFADSLAGVDLDRLRAVRAEALTVTR